MRKFAVVWSTGRKSWAAGVYTPITFAEGVSVDDEWDSEFDASQFIDYRFSESEEHLISFLERSGVESIERIPPRSDRIPGLQRLVSKRAAEDRLSNPRGSDLRGF